MAPTIKASSTATLPSLLAINQDLTDLDEQIRRATQIIGLPQDWDTIQDEKIRLVTLQRVMRPRAEWSLRWILDKLKDEAHVGTQARGSSTAWKFLDSMIQVVPTISAATQLNDADFPTILEKTLEENFDGDAALRPETDTHEAHSTHMSESSETVHEDPRPSKKRKRGSSGHSAASKRATAGPDALGRLFIAVKTVVKSILRTTEDPSTSEEMVHTEPMRMVVRTETAQAARILKFWLVAVQRLLSAGSLSGSHQSLDLSLAVELWELRTADSNSDSGASAEQFSTECLVPTLALYDNLFQIRVEEEDWDPSTGSTNGAIYCLERLLARHLFAPSHAAFFAVGSGRESDTKANKATVLASNLEPLRAKLLQAAQIYDTSQPIPAFFMPLFNAVPKLLDIAVRLSPSRTQKARISKAPWNQAVFVALAECVGCSFDAPDHATLELSITALKKSISVLALHNISIDTEVLRDLFWFHSGVKFPLGQKRTVRWSFISALIEIDPAMFNSGLSSTSSPPKERPSDLAEYLFSQISAWNSEYLSSAEGERMDIDDSDQEDGLANAISAQDKTEQKAILDSIIIPVMSAFARSRNLAGFLRQWDNQLCLHVPRAREALKELRPSIWEDRSLTLALAGLVEQSLTQSQLSELFQQHANRLTSSNESRKSKQPTNDDSLGAETYAKMYSSSVLIQALLESIDSDETIESLQAILHSLIRSYASRVQDDRHRSKTNLESYWITLSRLLLILWPVTIHGSSDVQREVLHPLIERAQDDVAGARKTKETPLVDSHTRASAMLFLLTACDLLALVPGTGDLVRKSVRKTLNALSPSSLEATQLLQMIEVFCSEFIQLLEFFEVDDRLKAFRELLSETSKLEDICRGHIVDALSEHVFLNGSASLQHAYVAALLHGVAEDDDDEGLRVMALSALDQVHPSALSREQRETALNTLTELLETTTSDPAPLLSIMVHLMEIPNATAKISSNANTFFEIAQILHDRKLESPPVLQVLQDLVKSTLMHILPNKEQDQNERYLTKFGVKLEIVSKKARKCFPARLAILRATVLAQKDHELLSVDRYVALLSTCLNDGTRAAPQEYILDALSELPSGVVRNDDAVFSTAQASLRAWINAKELDDLLKTPGSLTSTIPTSLLIRIQSTMARFQIYPDATWFVQLSIRILREDISDRDKITVYNSVGDAFSSLTISGKLDLVPFLTQGGDDANVNIAYRLLHNLMTTVDDRQADEVETKQKQLTLLPGICQLLEQCSTYPAFNALLDSVNTIIRHKPSLTTQHSIECALEILVKFSSRRSPALPAEHAPAVYNRLCETTRLILLLHRGRLGGRFHLLLPLLQNLLYCLFIPNVGRGNALPVWLKSSPTSTPTRLTPVNAAQYGRLLSTLCSPTQSSVQKSKAQFRAHNSSRKGQLNDPVKAAREYVSHYIYPLLASFSRNLLNGRLDPRVREKLMPGVWEVVGVAGMDQEALDAMFAGLDSSTKDVWRGVWSEWKRIHGRRQTREVV
ncbi:Urb2/Npa2 family-domain-containing protein [Massariosphaeria phaeospora]|uniref:Urb2/Npa2 family-domain-containing protein n=1 Tax=Massariosphaeria phaeospora TaxID=100035 RepID=A0A7C8IIK6_9PLEO|nr:Urb2/Npa2 family-domain-containing protein [Massariosphaeria phaeospora]